MQIFSDSQFKYTANHNQFHTCNVTHVLNLIKCDSSANVLNILVSVFEWLKALG